MNTSIIDEIKSDTLEELASRRKALISFGKLGAGLVLGSLPITLALASQSAYARQGGAPADVAEVLNYALKLEYLERNFYQRGTNASGLINSADMVIFNQIRKHEEQHVTLLVGAIQAMGAQPIAEPNFNYTKNFPDIFTNYQTFLTVAQAFEDTGVRAYKGRGAELFMLNKDVLTTALRIHSVEARHAAMVRRLRGLKGWIESDTAAANLVPAAAAAVYAGEMDMTPLAGVTVQRHAAYDEPLTPTQVNAIVSLFE
ncbi:MAG: ferritin-like domain-containing protein [bacterium]|nr:ferritin-like domain-containing protein [Candidatus Kapabacteria bacterium]